MRNAATTGKRCGYGWLYNNPGDLNDIIPVSWELPNNTAWDDLIAHIGGTSNGYKLKSTKNEWSFPNTGATDAYLFSGLPGGRRTNGGVFENINLNAYFWSRTLDTISNYWCTSLIHNSTDISYAAIHSWHGLSVRCVQVKDPLDTEGDTGFITDIDGNVYKWIVIGGYRWTTENLRTTKFNNGDTIPEVTDGWGSWTSVRCAYNNDHYLVYPPN